MQTRHIGSVEVSAIGLGAMHLSRQDVDPERATATVHAALDAGMTLIDTADAYAPDENSMGHNERVVAEALRSYGADTSHVLVATKGGHVRTAGGGWDLDGRPDYLRQACERSLRVLGVEAIGVYQHHRPDPKVPYEDTMGALKELHDAGKVRAVGISNADVDQIRTAQAVLGDALVSVQNELSPAFRSSEGELEYCTEHGLAFLPWSPFGGMSGAAELGSRFAAFGEVARAHGVSAQAVCLAWLLAKSPVMVPIPGSSRPETAKDSAAAAELPLTDEERARLDETA
ncbi:MAG: aldo/keto reductase [Actinomycetota bacterium]|nr:aldo/keto reductase [Actinomycetota bacterium]